MPNVLRKDVQSADDYSADDYDVALVGSGLSSSSTLMQILDQLEATPGSRPVRIAIFEKDRQFFTGIPYGARSGATSLIITPVKEFLPPAERDDFMAWLARNSDWILEDVEKKGGALSEDLLSRCRSAIEAGDCSEFHIPRYLFGIYLTETLNERLSIAEQKGQLVYRLVQSEVVEISRRDDVYQLRTMDDGVYESRSVVLALGTAPNRTLLDQYQERLPEDSACLVEDPYLPDLTATLDRVIRFARRPNARAEQHVLLIGANATSLEMLYSLNNAPELREINLSFHIMAPQGKMPGCFQQIDKPRLEPNHLNILKSSGEISADAILDAVKADLADAKARSLGISDTLPVISKVVNELVGMLDLEQKKDFVRFAGIEIGRLQRRAGSEYSDVARVLQAEQRLELVAGRFVGLAENGDGGVDVAYQATSDGTERHLSEQIDIVVNCSGSSGLNRPNTSPLIDSLLASGLCQANASGAGFAVNDRMEAAENLYIIGPMLAGNVVGDMPVWHMEHCGRIISFSKKLAQNMTPNIKTNIAA